MAAGRPGRDPALTALKTFFADYRAAWRAWAGARTEEARRAIVFPAGTYWMRRAYGVTCAHLTERKRPVTRAL